MPNPRHDDTGRFCNKDEMLAVINNTAISGDTENFLKLRADFAEAEKSSISINSIFNVINSVEKFTTSKFAFINKLTEQSKENRLTKNAQVALKYFPQAVNNMKVRNMGGTPLNVKVSEEEQAAIHHYVAGYDLNNDVYGGNKSNDLKDDCLNHNFVLNHSRKLLDQVFSRIPETGGEPTKTFRGMRSSDWKGNNFQQEFLNKLEPGEKLTFTGYSSTSPNETEANFFADDSGAILELQGTGGLHLDANSPEVLYRRNTNWIVVSAIKNSNGLIKAVLKMT